MGPFRSSIDIPPTMPRQTRVRGVLFKAGLEGSKTIAEIVVGTFAEPVFDIGGGFFVASFAGLDKYRKLNPEWFGYDAHHVLEEQHLKLFPDLNVAWTRAEMPSVLLPKAVHAAIAGDLKEALRIGIGHSKQEVLEAYANVYHYVSHGHLLSRVVRAILRI